MWSIERPDLMTTIFNKDTSIIIIKSLKNLCLRFVRLLNWRVSLVDLLIECNIVNLPRCSILHSLRMVFLPTGYQLQWTNISWAIIQLRKWRKRSNHCYSELTIGLNKPMAMIWIVPMRIWLDRFFDVFDESTEP